MDAMTGVDPDSKVDFLVVGGGIAGLRAAIELASAGSTLILTKGESSEFSPRYARGGAIRDLLGDEDIALHLHQTLESGEGLCREEAVRILVEEAPQQIQQLGQWGAKFEMKSAPSGGRRRIIRSLGHPIGIEILQALLRKAQSLPSLRKKSPVMVVDLLLDGQRVCGAMYLDEASGSFRRIHAAAVLLATGGLGRVYAETTNPPGACGDGVALAFRAGALLADMEFIQFRPTVLYVNKAPRLALSLALCEKGAKLRNLELERFMPRYHEAGELAPPDIMTRAILMEMHRSRSDFVYLDLTGADPEETKRRFPQVVAACLKNNIDITSDLVPIRPAADFAMGGIVTDVEGAASVRGLYAVGETASTGVHGANRLTHNSLLEGLVFGARVAKAVIAKRDNAMPPSHHSSPAKPAWLRREDWGRATAEALDAETVAKEIRNLMWNNVGVIRHGQKLKEAIARLNSMILARPSQPHRHYFQTE
ncbi:MAG TPA: FAD-binding protein, partial [Terriglobia bacterium]|nr:FAD-binding protein [Terriglobia bacterium]